jgi:multidrug efflux pump subunit AcrB
VTGWVIKPVEIDDVPIVNLTLYSDRYDDYALRRMAEELEIRLQGVKNAGRTYLVGGRPRQIRVRLSPQLMASRGISIQDMQRAIQGANVSLPAGNLIDNNEETRLDAGRFLIAAPEVANLILGVQDGRPVYLREVAAIEDGPAEPETYTRIVFGERAYSPIDPAGEKDRGLPATIQRFQDYPSVTVAVAKRKGTNAVQVSEEILKEARRFAREVLPEGVHMRTTRDFGRTADEKVNEIGRASCRERVSMFV